MKTILVPVLVLISLLLVLSGYGVGVYAATQSEDPLANTALALLFGGVVLTFLIGAFGGFDD